MTDYHKTPTQPETYC